MKNILLIMLTLCAFTLVPAQNFNDWQTYTWTAADSMSPRINLDDFRPGGVELDTGWTGNYLWLFASRDTARSSAKPVYFQATSTKVGVGAAANSIILFVPAEAYNTYQYIWFKSLSGTATVTQAFARTFRVIKAKF